MIPQEPLQPYALRAVKTKEELPEPAYGLIVIDSSPRDDARVFAWIVSDGEWVLTELASHADVSVSNTTNGWTTPDTSYSPMLTNAFSVASFSGLPEELLVTHAARAIGKTQCVWRNGFLILQPQDLAWNSLRSSYDAFDLLVEAPIDLEYLNSSSSVRVTSRPIGRYVSFVLSNLEQRHSVLRKAITYAAALPSLLAEGLL